MTIEQPYVYKIFGKYDVDYHRPYVYGIDLSSLPAIRDAIAEPYIVGLIEADKKIAYAQDECAKLKNDLKLAEASIQIFRDDAEKARRMKDAIAVDARRLRDKVATQEADIRRLDGEADKMGAELFKKKREINSLQRSIITQSPGPPSPLHGGLSINMVYRSDEAYKANALKCPRCNGYGYTLSLSDGLIRMQCYFCEGSGDMPNHKSTAGFYAEEVGIPSFAVMARYAAKEPPLEPEGPLDHEITAREIERGGGRIR